jgi:hypothetical protein
VGDAGTGVGAGSLFERPQGNQSAANVPRPPPTNKARTMIRVNDLVFGFMSSLITLFDVAGETKNG